MSFWSGWSDGKKWFMGILSALIIASLIGLANLIIPGESGLPEQQVSFLASSEAPFAVQSSFQGTAKVSGEQMNIAVEEATITYSNDRVRSGSRYIEDVRVSLVEAAGESSWRPLRRSDRHEIGRSIASGEAIALDPFRVNIDIQGLESLAGYWLVFDVAERLPSERSTTGSSHSHTRSDLF